MTNMFMRNARISTTLSLFALTLFCQEGFAQTTSGDLTGRITDPSGAVVSGATVETLDQGTGVKAAQTTTGAGTYHFANLPIGSYTVTVTAKGFQTAQVKDLVIDLNKQSTQNFALQVGTATTTIEVTESAATIDTSTAQITGNYDSREAAELPSASTGSGVINLSLLQGGVGTSGSTGSGTGPSIGGTRPFYNSFTVEGIDTNDRSVTGPVLTVPNDAVGEFTLIANQFAPEFGHSSGGQFNTTIKSGTNSFHGSAYEYFENRNLDSADNLNYVQGNPLHPRFDDNRFGGDFGGPVIKNKLFFYSLYEYEPTGASASGGSVFAPTAAGYTALSKISGINQTNLGILQKYLGTAPTASAPGDTPNGAYPTVGPGNLSLGLQDPSAVSVPIGQIATQSPSYTNSERAVSSVDYTLSDKDNLRGRFILSRSGGLDTSGYPSQFYVTLPSNAYVVTMSEYHNFTPNLVNEFRLGYNRLNAQYGVPNISFPGLDAFPNIVLYDLGGVNIGPDPNAPQGGIQNTYQLTDNVSWTKGNHTIRFGFDGLDWISPQIFTQRSRGDYEWSYMSDYLFDYYPDYLAQRNVGARKYYGNNQLYSFYANDIWKVTSTFTVNLGLRYEYETVPLGIQQSNLNIVANVPGLLDFSSPQATKRNFMPRIGLAWSPDAKTSIRAGFGTALDQIRDNLGLLTSPPEFSSTVDVTGNPGTGFLAHGGISPSSLPSSPTVQQLISETSGILPHVLLRPNVATWNLDVQRVYKDRLTLDARYVGTHGYHLSVQDQLNRRPVVNASNALPVYLQAPSQATLNSLTTSLTALTNSYNNFGDIVPAYNAAGVNGIVTSYQPWGSSSYNGLSLEAKYNYTNGLQFIGAYTWSHDLDNSTADVFSTYTTPRRPQDAQNLTPDYASSALDHRQRFTYAAVYTLPFFQKSTTNWFLKNVVGNWDAAPIYTFQSGTLATAQAGVDANLNGDSAGDRTIINTAGNPAIGTGVTALKNSAGTTVAFLANNPGAGYIATPKGALATGGRNTLVLPRIDDIDLSLIKKFNITERFKFQIGLRATNIFNHPQYTGGNLNDVAPTGQTSGNVHNALIPSISTFGQWSQVFSSNPRFMQISAKFSF